MSNPNGHTSIWSRVPGLLAELANCIQEKWSSRQTAAKLSEIAGQPINRNQVIGEARRKGMAFTGGKPRPKAPKWPPIRPVKRQVPFNITREKPVIHQQPEPPALPPEFLSLAILDLPLNGCRYPAGDGPILFCGQPQLEGSSYCLFHKNICTTRPEGKSWFALRDLKSPTLPIRSTPQMK